MSELKSETESESRPRERSKPPAWLRSAAIWVGAAIAIAALVILGVALLPTWWANLTGGWVHGVKARGIVLGLSIGAAFTVVPLAVALLAFRSGLTVRTRVILIVVALLLLLPNVLTLAVALSSTDAHSVMAIESPGFRGASAVGVGLTIAVIVAVVIIRWWVGRTRRKTDEARERAIVLTRERVAAAEADAIAEPGPDAETVVTPDPDADSAAEPVPAGETVVEPGPDGDTVVEPHPDPVQEAQRASGKAGTDSTT